MAPLRPKNRRNSIPLADLVGPAVGPALARQGFGQADVILHWEDIVGSRLADWSEPIKLQWPPRNPRRGPDAAPEPATLVVRIEGAFALELQHMAPIVIERVNAHLGWHCVGRLALRQGPLARSRRERHKPPAPSPAAQAAAARMVEGIADPGLRDALVRLGAGILSNRTG